MGLSLRMSCTVDAPVEVVFAQFSDLRRAAERISGITRMEVLTEGPVGVGTIFRETRIMFGREATEQMEVTEFEPNSMYAVECTSCGVHYRSELEFRARGDSTEVAMSFDGQPRTKTAKILGAFMGMLMKGACRKAMEQDLADMKRAVEASVR